MVEDKNDDSEFKLRGNLNIIASSLSIINQNLPEREQVWLDAENLNAEIAEIDVNGSTYLAQIMEMNFDAVKNGEKYQLKELLSLIHI